MPIATTDEQVTLQAAIREREKQSGPLAQIRDREPGAAPARHDGLGVDLPGCLAGLALREHFAHPAVSALPPRRAGLAADPATAGELGALVAGGMTQILLFMVAERGLGLPLEEVR